MPARGSSVGTRGVGVSVGVMVGVSDGDVSGVGDGFPPAPGVSVGIQVTVTSSQIGPKVSWALADDK